MGTTPTQAIWTFSSTPVPKQASSILPVYKLRFEDALGIKVDVRDPEELHRSFREQVLSEALPV